MKTTYNKQNNLLRINDCTDIDIWMNQACPDQRQLSVWHRGTMACARWGRYKLTVYTTGSVSAGLYESGKNGECSRMVYRRRGGVDVLPRQAETDNGLLTLARNHKRHAPDSLCLILSPNNIEYSIYDRFTGKVEKYTAKSRNVFLAIEEGIQMMTTKIMKY